MSDLTQQLRRPMTDAEIRSRGLVCPCVVPEHACPGLGLRTGLYDGGHTLTLWHDLVMMPDSVHVRIAKERVLLVANGVVVVSPMDEWTQRGLQVDPVAEQERTAFVTGCCVLSTGLRLTNTTPGIIRIFAGVPVARICFFIDEEEA